MAEKQSPPWDVCDRGCYADGVNGHRHIRNKLAKLVTSLGDASDENLARSLHGDMPDDCWDEDAALELLNANSRGVTWCLVDGDLMLVED